MTIDQRLMKILVCPACHGDLKLLEHDSGIECIACSLLYPIRDGIPVMLVEEAERRSAPPTKE